MSEDFKRPRWSIARKGFLSIGIFLLVQLCFFVGNAWLLQQTEFIVQKENHSRQVLGHTNWIIALIANATQSSTEYAISGDPARRQNYELASTKIAEEFDQLSHVLAQDTAQKRQTEKLDELWKQMKAICDGLLLLHTDSAEQKITRLSENQKQLSSLWASASDARRQLLLEERTRVNTLYESSTAGRDVLKLLLMSGVAASILAALLAFDQFSKRIVKRIDQMSDNVKRLESGLALTPIVPGSDEIAEFDRTFHRTADALNEAKGQLEQRERQMVTMIDNMPVGLIAVNKAGKVEFSNPMAREIYASDPRGRELATLLPVGDTSGMSILRAENSGVRQFQLENKLTNKPFVLEVSARDMTIGDDEKLLLMLQDVTQKRELERLREEFVAVVSHDLRTPLSSIHLFLVMMEELDVNIIPQDLKKSLSIAKRSTTRLLNLVNDLLDYAKLETGEFNLRITRFALAEILVQSVQAVSHFAQKNHIQIEQTCPDIEIEADEERLIQVMINLLSNAIKFSPDQGSISIGVTTGSDWIEVSVKDNGRGIAVEHQTAIFEKYKQVSETDNRRGKGTGLGLPICKAIIERHGGTIGVKSIINQGSSFWFRIPISHKATEKLDAPDSLTC